MFVLTISCLIHLRAVVKSFSLVWISRESFSSFVEPAFLSISLLYLHGSETGLTWSFCGGELYPRRAAACRAGGKYRVSISSPSEVILISTSHFTSEDFRKSKVGCQLPLLWHRVSGLIPSVVCSPPVMVVNMEVLVHRAATRSKQIATLFIGHVSNKKKENKPANIYSHST